MAIVRKNYGRNHGYTIDGEKAIGVTTALAEGVPKPALISWAAKCVARRVVDMPIDDYIKLLQQGRDGAIRDLADTHVKERTTAAVRGTKVHNLAEKVIAGAEVEVPDDLYGHVEAAVKFMDDWQVRPVLAEKVIGCYSYGYAGTFDLIGDLPDGRRVLFDYKTGASGIWPETAMQLAAYRWASHYVGDDGTEIPMSEVGINEAMAVHVRGDGYDVYPLNTDMVVFGAFLSALRMARHRQDWQSWVGAPVQPAVAA